jgi:diacylglycerol kinase
MASVLILELINTAIEAIVDMVSPEIQEKAKIAKDVSAGAVLVASIAAVFIGGLIFLPKILH